MRTLYHLSHTDLDGYSCQYISAKYFDKTNFYNSNYGDEITATLGSIFRTIAENKEDAFVLITDLNLNLMQCDYVNEEIRGLKEQNIDISVQLLDHHKSGAESAKQHSWYLLDNARSATKITFDYFMENYEDRFNDQEKRYIQAVNAADIWLEKDALFEFGKVGLNLISGSKEVNRYMFANESNAFYMYLITRAIEYVDLDKAHIKLDSAIHALKKEFLNQREEDDTLENLKSYYITKLLSDKKEELKVEYKGHIGIMTFALGSISVLANRFLKENRDIDFFMDVGVKGSVSFRADGAIDVAQASKVLFGGGGHANAAGGKYQEFKESYDYKSAKEQIDSHLLAH
jgi:oligoribonuclease NrnB/cAMP/cGMP phosphodiesterase (DHH superfamily)